ncbi:MAG: ATP/GTP-binding protein [Agathobacter sp.]
MDEKVAVRNLRLCTKDCLCLYVCPVGATDTENSVIIEALEQGRILVVDELDSSIHFKLTRAIVAMFNNELNTSAQMIFTVHDINLMDCKRMFRKEQIWFIHKDEEGVYVYSLADFTAQQGVRDTTDVMEKYRKGALGALPDPELINSLLSIKGDVKGG